MKLTSSGVNSCSDLIGCLWSITFLAAFWHLDMQSHFACDVFVYYFLFFCGSSRGFPSVVPSPERNLMRVWGFCSRVAWGCSRPSHQASGHFGSVASLKVLLSVAFLGPMKWWSQMVGRNRFFLARGWCGILFQPCL